MCPLQLHLHVVGEIRGVDLLLERAEAVPQHHDFVEEGLDGPALLLQAGRAGAQHERAATPLLGRHDRREARLLADDAAQDELEVVGRAFWEHDGRGGPFAGVDQGNGSPEARRAIRAPEVAGPSRLDGVAGRAPGATMRGPPR